MRHIPYLFLLTLGFLCRSLCQAEIVATFNSGTDVPITSNGFSAAGETLTPTLNFVPPAGTMLMVVKNTSAAFIGGSFINLAHGQSVGLSHAGINYRFTANYYGGNGNDLVLEWGNTRPAGWGSNFSGVLDPFTPQLDKLPPTDLRSLVASAGKPIVALAAGDGHSVALCSDGTLLTWGSSNTHSVLGRTTGGLIGPVSPAGALAGKTIVSIAASSTHNLALCSDGSVATWGSNFLGQLGNDSSADSNTPVPVNVAGALAGKTVVAVAAGEFHSLALCSDGTVAAWGYNIAGQLGNNSTVNSRVPVAVDTTGVLSGKTVIQVAAGYGHSLALCSDGSVFAWGGGSYGTLGNNNTSGSSVPVAVDTSGALSGKSVVAVSSGSSHNLALCSDGTLVAWGNNELGQLGNNSYASATVPVGVVQTGVLAGKTVVQIATGDTHSIARCNDGTLAVWGWGGFGQLGNGSTGSPVPVAVSGSPLAAGESYSAISCGSSADHTFAFIAARSVPVVNGSFPTNITKTGVTLNGTVDPDGTPATAYFEYGLSTNYGNTATVTLSPSNGIGAQEVSANLSGLTPGTVYHYRLTVVTANHTVRTANSTFATSMDRVATFSAATAVPATAEAFSANGSTITFVLNFAPLPGTNLTALKNTGAALIEGKFDNLEQGQLVTLTYNGMNYRFIANYHGGTGNDLVLHWVKTRLVAWGYNTAGQLGDNTTWEKEVPVPVISAGALAGKTILSAVAGDSHSLALCADGTIVAWGANYRGQSGTNGPPSSPVPVPVYTAGALSGKTVVAVAAGNEHSLALSSDGTVVAWGYNQYGQLGNKSTTDSTVPVLVTGGALAGKRVTAIDAGMDYSIALCSDGTLAAWGKNFWGQLGDGSTRDSSVPVAVSTSSVLFGKTVTSISVGRTHTLALCSDGTIAAWGSGISGALGNNSTNNSAVPVAVVRTGVLAGRTVTEVSAGEGHNLALCSDGSIAGWGSNSNGELGDIGSGPWLAPVTVNKSGALLGRTVVALTSNYRSSFGLCADGTLAAWGENSWGQLGNANRTSTSVPVSVSSGALTVGERYSAIFPGKGLHNLALVASPSLLSVADPGVSSVTETGAILTGVVDPNGSPAVAKFEYGLTTNYGSLASATLSPPDGVGPQKVSASLTGLTPGVVYHYRLTATNGAGSVSTIDGTFATPIDLNVTFNSPADVAFTANRFSAEGDATFTATLNFAPPVGTNLVVVNNTGTDFIKGYFSNLAHGEVVRLSYAGINYRFVANYYGGTGNDLVLQWAKTRLAGWGRNATGKLGDGSGVDRLVPVDVISTGVLAGKIVLRVAAGEYHSLAVCSDGTVAAWGSNHEGQLGDGSEISSGVPVAVDTAGVLSGKTVVALAAGSTHSLALCSDGTVVGWGDGWRYQLGNNTGASSNVPVVIPVGDALPGKTVVALATGNDDSFALCSDGTVATWGNTNRIPKAMSASGALATKKVVSLAASEGGHCLALCSDGTVAAWGANYKGQLGDGSTTTTSVPVAVSTAGVLANKTVVSVGVGIEQSFALCSDGTVAAWGYNSVGQLGDGSTVSWSPVPVAVDRSGVLAGRTIQKLVPGTFHALVLCGDGSIAGWGGNSGMLGNGSLVDSNVPVLVSSSPLAAGERYVAAFSGPAAMHNFALIAATVSPTVSIQAATNVSKNGATLHGTVDPNGNSAIAYFEYGLTSNYGTNAGVSLSQNDGVGPQMVSANLSGLLPGTTYHYRLTVTNSAGTASTSDGTFFTRLNFTPVTYSSPADVPFSANQVAVGGESLDLMLGFAPTPGTNLTVVQNRGIAFIEGAFSNIAQGQLVTLNFGGVAYPFVANYFGGSGNDLVLQWAPTRPVAWGTNNSGQIGDASGISRLIPTNVRSTGVLAGKVVLSAAAGDSHSVALCSDGTVTAWGSNTSGQLGVSGSTSFVPVKVNMAGVLADKVVAAVAAGRDFNLALCSDGSIAAWGSNSAGQLGNNTTTLSVSPVLVNTDGVLSGKFVTAVAAGRSHCLALCSDGTVVSWGSNSNGQLGNFTGTNSLVPVAVNTSGALANKTVTNIAAGELHSLALCSDGSIAAWGSNSNGQLGNNTTNSSYVPVLVISGGLLSGKTVNSVAAGRTHSLALCSDGTLSAWGLNSSGQLGAGGTAQSSVPVAVNMSGVLSGKSVIAVAAGTNQSYAMCSDGSIGAWGSNTSGRLGNNSTVSSNVPVLVSSTPLGPGERYGHVAAGSYAFHAVGLIATPPPPAVSSTTATNITSTSATLNGLVNAVNGSATASFDFGLDTLYGSTASAGPSPVTGPGNVPVSANLSSLAPNTTYHCRLRATSSGGTTDGTDFTFTTLPDTTAPTGGMMRLSRNSPVEPGALLTVTFSNWLDASPPLAYAVSLDDVDVSLQGAAANRAITMPATVGDHTIKGRIYDAVGNLSEITQTITVVATREEWRAFWFGTTADFGDAADAADPDGDGNDNHLEYVAGLGPTNSNSRFRVRVETVPGQPNQKAITFGPVVGGRVYALQFKASLADPEWTPLTDVTTSDNGEERTIIDLSAGSELRFYRVGIQLH